MNPQSKNKLLNILMVLAIALIALSAVMAVGHAKGWFGQKEASVQTGQKQPDSGGKSEAESAKGEKKESASESDSGKNAEKTAENAGTLTEKPAGSGGENTQPDKAASAGNTPASGSPSSSSSGTAGSKSTSTDGAGSSKSGSSASSASSGSGQTSTSSGSGKSSYTCIVTIVCSEILSHMDDLTEGKEPFVPSDGIILSGAKVSFEQGTSAYDATRTACDAAGIQMEAAYTPVYGSYYIEGINQLYEFDCGKRSGWIYTVNGTSPNYGCSDYLLQDGDQIVWEYTCTGR